jgi:hypothetical protein
VNGKPSGGISHPCGSSSSQTFASLRTPCRWCGEHLDRAPFESVLDGLGWRAHEGIETGREPPEYARISEALWVRAKPYLGGRRPHPRIGKTLVDFTCSTLRRRAGLDDMIEINSVRVPTQGLEGLWSAPGVVERMRRTYPALMQAPPDQLGMSVTPHRTGFAGRPSAKHLVAAEMEKRAKNGEFKSSMRKEAKELADWYAATHPEDPSTSDGAIRNSLAHVHRRLKGQAAATPD